MKRFALLVLALHLVLNSALAAAPGEAELTRRGQRLAESLRCVVCENSTLAESNASVAVDLRRHIRERLAAGASDAQIVDELAARYGDYIRYQPPLTLATLPLWFGPPLLALLGAGLLWRRLRRSPT